MSYFLLTIALSAALFFAGPPTDVRAESPKPTERGPGADLFDQAWKYDQGLGTPIDTSRAVSLYRQSAAQGNPLARARLSRIYFTGNGVVADVAVAERQAKDILPDVLRAAEAGDPIAQVSAGSLYADGLGVARDSAAALAWTRRAADQKLPLAQFNLGILYEHGVGVPRDEATAVTWYTRAAEQGNAMAQAYLGDFYHNGRSVPRDEGEAVRLFTLAAARNQPHAQTNLGYLYDHGCGVPRDRSSTVPGGRRSGFCRRPGEPGHHVRKGVRRAARPIGGRVLVPPGGGPGGRERRPRPPVPGVLTLLSEAGAYGSGRPNEPQPWNLLMPPWSVVRSGSATGGADRGRAILTTGSASPSGNGVTNRSTSTNPTAQ